MVGIGFGTDGPGLLPILGALVALYLLLTFGMSRASKGRRAFRGGFVTIVTGRKGHGKSMFTVHEALRHIGKPVYCRKCSMKPEIRERFGAIRVKGGQWGHLGSVASNAALKLSDSLLPYWFYVAGWDDVAVWVVDDETGRLTVEEKLPHGTLLIVDEAHLWCPIQDGQVLPKRQKLLLSQLRKLVIEGVFVTQSLLNVAVGLRRQTDEVGVCRRGMWGRMCITFWDPEAVQKPGQDSLWKYAYRVRKRVANAYDTYELIVPAEDSDDELPARGRGRDRASGPARPPVAIERAPLPVVEALGVSKYAPAPVESESN